MPRGMTVSAGSLLAGLVIVANSGCALFESNCAAKRYSAWLDQETRIELTEYGRFNMLLAGADFNCRTLTLTVDSESGIFRSESVGRVDGSDWRHVPPIELGELEGRANAARTKVWIIDKDAQRIIATLDLEAGTTTGLEDQPPAWARLGEGLVLKPTASD